MFSKQAADGEIRENPSLIRRNLWNCADNPKGSMASKANDHVQSQSNRGLAPCVSCMPLGKKLCRQKAAVKPFRLGSGHCVFCPKLLGIASSNQPWPKMGSSQKRRTPKWLGCSWFPFKNTPKTVPSTNAHSNNV